jgi:hypothetical protein
VGFPAGSLPTDGLPVTTTDLPASDAHRPPDAGEQLALL